MISGTSPQRKRMFKEVKNLTEINELSLLYSNSEEPPMMPLIHVNFNPEVNAQPKRDCS